MDGALTLAGAPVRIMDMGVQQALNTVYAALVRYMGKDDREEIDGWLTVTWEQLPSVTQDEQDRRRELVAELGEIG